MEFYKYVCGYILDDNKLRQYTILLVKFVGVKELVSLEAECRYKFSSHNMYPKIASDLDKENSELIPHIEHIINFETREGFRNETFDSLEECSYFFRKLIKQEKEYTRKQSFVNMVNYSQIPFVYWDKCLELATNRSNLEFFMYEDIPCYKVFPHDAIYSVIDNTVIKYGDN